MMVRDGSCACGECSITCREAESLFCTPDANVTVYGNSTQVRKINNKEGNCGGTVII